jgi:hypothetical protein
MDSPTPKTEETKMSETKNEWVKKNIYDRRGLVPGSGFECPCCGAIHISDNAPGNCHACSWRVPVPDRLEELREKIIEARNAYKSGELGMMGALLNYLVKAVLLLIDEVRGFDKP